ncbi:hypothetical protein [Mesorhizobium sp.]|uniref:hypothetical protein n=1 Tax=Mesorhizobium sp. TaxID=1871066 RepID=UPI0025798149|nr:hypothetical protein [Mesorhizobium sp.]
MVAQRIEISRDFQEVPDYNRSAGTVGLEMANVTIEQLLIDMAKIDSTKLIAHKTRRSVVHD